MCALEFHIIIRKEMFLNHHEYIKIFIIKKYYCFNQVQLIVLFFLEHGNILWGYQWTLIQSVRQQKHWRRKIHQAIQCCWRSCITKKCLPSQLNNPQANRILSVAQVLYRPLRTLLIFAESSASYSPRNMMTLSWTSSNSFLSSEKGLPSLPFPSLPFSFLPLNSLLCSLSLLSFLSPSFFLPFLHLSEDNFFPFIFTHSDTLLHKQFTFSHIFILFFDWSFLSGFALSKLVLLILKTNFAQIWCVFTHCHIISFL